MFLNPVCHWGGYDGPEPLFEEDFRSGPIGLEFPITTDWYTSRAYAAPTSIYDFEESTPGDTIIDRVSGYNLTAVADAGTYPMQGRTAVGLPKLGEVRNWSWKKCAEYQLDKQYYHYLNNADTTLFDLTPGGTPRSLAGLYVIRGMDGSPAQDLVMNRCLVSKADNGTHEGWGIANYIPGGAASITPWVTGSGYTCGNRNNALAHQWCCVLFGFDQRTTDTWSYSGWGVDGSPIVGGWPLESSQKFQVGYGPGGNPGDPNTCGVFQIAYLVLWVGAAAESVRADYLGIYNDFWASRMLEPGSRYTGVPVTHPTIDVNLTQWHAGIVEDGANGVVLLDYDNGVMGYDMAAAFPNTGKLGGRFGGYSITECWDYTDVYNNAVWTKSNITVSTANADLDDGPNGFREIQKLTATANSAQIYQPAATGANFCVMGFFYKRHASMGSNVTGRFRLLNLTTMGYEFDWPFTATDKWQHHEETVTPANSGCRIIVELDNNGDSLALARVYGVQNQRLMSRNMIAGQAASYATNFYGAMPSIEAWCHSDQGEIEVIFHTLFDDVEALYHGLLDVGASDNDDRRIIGADNVTGDIESRIYNAGGTLVEQTRPIAMSYGQTHTWIFQWNHSVAQFNGRYSRVVMDGVEYPGIAVPFTQDGNRLSLLWIGRAKTSATYVMNCLIARLRIWAAPWQYL